MANVTPPPPPADLEPGGFFGALFDFSFATFVTPRIIKVIYAVVIVVIGLFYLVGIGAGFSQSVGSGLLILIVGAVVALLYILLFRMLLEFYIATFRIAENTGRMADAMDKRP